MRKLKVDTAFIDLQGTITDDISRNNYFSDPDLRGDYFGGILRDTLIKKFRISSSEALERIKEVTNPCGWFDPFYAVSHSDWGISEEEIWRKILKWQNEHIIVIKDAIDMVKELRRRNFNLYMVSNCAKKVVLAQLTTAKLAKRNNSSYFKQIYGCFDLGLQKDNPLVYEKILRIEDLAPEEVVMIGNEPGIDSESPHKAGICYSIIVDRKQKNRIIAKDGAIFVNSLRIVPQILK
ncbi:MAG: HAD hydrolase-like protein [Candidatus Omnitrophica bacterium]|nr:HAD hydrolase-like protein [Candidatus Omnitrophota bacterium]